MALGRNQTRATLVGDERSHPLSALYKERCIVQYASRQRILNNLNTAVNLKSVNRSLNIIKCCISAILRAVGFSFKEREKRHGCPHPSLHHRMRLSGALHHL